MKVTIDLNVLLDVVQERQPHYPASAAVLTRVVEQSITGFLPAHALTTTHYIVDRFAGREKAGELIDWLLHHFEIIEASKAEFIHARKLNFRDFEDAVVSACAARAGTECIISRNLADFRHSPVPALTPEEFLARAADLGQ